LGNKFHFKEIDLVIYFPSSGNHGRAIGKYGVCYRDRKNNDTQQGRRIDLDNVLAKPDLISRYPHTVGLYQIAAGRGATWKPAYLEKRVVQSEQDLLDWIIQIERL